MIDFITVQMCISQSSFFTFRTEQKDVRSAEAGVTGSCEQPHPGPLQERYVLFDCPATPPAFLTHDIFSLQSGFERSIYLHLFQTSKWNVA